MTQNNARTFSSPASLSAANVNALDGALNGYTEVVDAAQLAVQIIASAGISAGAIIFEGTNDLTATPVPVPVIEMTTTNTSPVAAAITIAANTARIFLVPCRLRYIRARISTAFVGGTIRAVTMLEDRPAQASFLPAQGMSAHDAPVAGNPVRSAARARTANVAAVAQDDTVDLMATVVGAQVVKPFSIPEGDWSAAAPAGGLTALTDQVLAAAAGAGLRRYLTGLQIRNASASVATEVVIKDGSTIIWRGQFPLNSPIEDIYFASPIKSSANAALNAACLTTGAAVYVNAQGYTAP